MVRKTLSILVGIFLVVLLLSCAKIPEYSGGDLRMEILTIDNTAPLKWGNLIAVVPAAEYATYVQLWFQDKEGNIYLVGYNAQKNNFSKDYRCFKRM